jgi:hypothetical protein
MSRSRCTVCRKPHEAGTAGVYSATFFGNGERAAYKNFMCPDCIQGNLVPLLGATPMDRSLDDNQACVICAVDTSDDPYYVYFTLFPPSGVRSDHEALLCLKCLTDVHAWIKAGGKPLPSREPVLNARVRTPEAWAFLAG